VVDEGVIRGDQGRTGVGEWGSTGPRINAETTEPTKMTLKPKE